MEVIRSRGASRKQWTAMHLVRPAADLQFRIENRVILFEGSHLKCIRISSDINVILAGRRMTCVRRWARQKFFAGSTGRCSKRKSGTDPPSNSMRGIASFLLPTSNHHLCTSYNRPSNYSRCSCAAPYGRRRYVSRPYSTQWHVDIANSNFLSEPSANHPSSCSCPFLRDSPERHLQAH